MLLIFSVFCVVLCFCVLFVFSLCFVCLVFPVSLDFPFLIAHSFFSNVYYLFIAYDVRFVLTGVTCGAGTANPADVHHRCLVGFVLLDL